MSQPPRHSPIAIVGMACRYPDADTASELFENSLAQRQSFRKIPELRLAPAYFDASGRATDRAYSQQAGVIKGFSFDRDWFRVSRASYEVTDLTHWLALTVARETVESIRFRPHGTPFTGDAVRVVVGNTLTGEFSRANQIRLRWPYVRGVVGQYLREHEPHLDEAALARRLHDLELRFKQPFPEPNEEFLAGGLANTIAGRICNHFNFRGGGYTIDGACASSLLAVTDACTALAAGDADMVLAGGVDLSLDPFELVGFSRTVALARNDMRVYDEQSEGFWPGEGCGFVALMRLEDALAQCEHIHAVIRGWGVSSDGRGGLTRPEADGQILALQRCYRRAGYGIESVGYFEGHGTGTKVGDTAELRALITARNTGHPLRPAIISSVKANIGHTKAAAGLAGLLRATLCVREQILPPTTACRQPHALLVANPGNLAVAEGPRRWAAESAARRAGISAMGFGGINTHITIEEAPPEMRPPLSPAWSGELTGLTAFQDAELFLFAAASRKDLAWTVDYIGGLAGECSRAELTDLAAELARRATRGALSGWKAAVVAATPAELSGKLGLLRDAIATHDERGARLAHADGVFVSSGHRRGRIGLLFSGQGSPVRAQGGIHARRFDAVAQIYRSAALEAFARRDDTDFAQPAIVAASLGGLAMLRGIGTDGDLAVGHSLGELTALHWAGCCDADMLLELAKLRGRTMADDRDTSGAMVAVSASRERAGAVIAGRSKLFIANINAPFQTVISGSGEEIPPILDALRRDGLAARLLPVSHAFHTPLMAGTAEKFGHALAGRRFAPLQRQVISTRTGNALASEIDVAAHLCGQLVSPVDYLGAINLAARHVDLFLEVGPGDLLTHLTRSFCRTPVLPIDTGGNSLAPFLLAAAAAYVLDCAPEIGQLFRDRFIRRFDWGWKPKFFRNPCETVPIQALPETEPHRRAEAQAADGAAAGQAVVDGSASTTDQLRQMIAERTGLPTWTIQDGNRMLSDLHLNSITVGEILLQITAARKQRPPADLNEYANASVAEIAAALDQLAQVDAAAPPDRENNPAGIGAWVRYFAVTHVPLAPLPVLAPEAGRPSGTWEGFGRSDERLRALLRQLNAAPYGNGVVVWLGDRPDSSDCSALLRAAHRCIERTGSADEAPGLVVIQPGWGGGGFARSFFLENESVATLLVNCPTGAGLDQIERIALEIGAMGPGFSEVILEPDGRREQPRLQLLTPPTVRPFPLLASNDVVLISGGGKGISAECGYQLARRTGCALLILGRSAPRDSAELASNLQRLGQNGRRVSYQIADVTDAGQVAAAIGRGVAELGAPVTAIVHGAGMNQPCLVASLTPDRIDKTVSPKVAGLDHLLAAVEPRRLKLLIGFGSIIARIGLRGEADYALGNEWLSHAIEGFRADHPHCRCHAIEWSVWSGAGMGQRLGRLDALLDQGIAPISIDGGVDEFLKLVDTPDLPVSLIVSGRFGQPATVLTDRPPAMPYRFIDSLPVYYAGIELVANCTVSRQSDLYLDDHMLNGERLFPAVMALEAMSEAAMALLRQDPAKVTPRFRDVLFRQAIVVPADAQSLTLRIVAMAGVTGEIALAIRSSATDFQINHVEAHCTLRGTLAGEAGTDDSARCPPALEIQPFDPEVALYRNVLFQKGRFQRVRGYQVIEARRCRARLASDESVRWFAEDLPQHCLLGDPGVRDAALHAIQACIPHKIVIPIAVGEIAPGVLTPGRAYGVDAREIEDRGKELVYDLTLYDQDNQPVERWSKLTLRVMGEPPGLRLNALPLMAPYFERQLAAGVPGAQLNVSIRPVAADRKTRRASIDPGHRPDGKPDAGDDARFRSSAWSDDWQLMVDAAVPVGCDLQPVGQQHEAEWQRMLGGDGFRLARAVADIARERFDVSATRIWTIREAMKKAGLATTAPLVVDPNSSARWLVFASGDSAIYSSLSESSAPDTAICVAVALRPVPQPQAGR